METNRVQVLFSASVVFIWKMFLLSYSSLKSFPGVSGEESKVKLHSFYRKKRKKKHVAAFKKFEIVF